MKPRYWSLAIVLILINYIIFATLFTRLLDTDFSAAYVTRTPQPTFTPAPAQPFVVIPTPTPYIPPPTPTATRVIQPAAPPAGDSLANQPPPPQPELVAPGPVNIRSGPGLNYSVIGRLNPNTTAAIVGRNTDASWWQIKITDDRFGWVSNSVVSARNTENVPLAQAPAPPPAPPSPQPASSAPPAQSQPQRPKYQYEPTGWYDDTNHGLTRFMGEIKDVNGNPVNGVFVQASCGDYSTISYPSGPVGWGALGESADWPPGFYDITVDSKPVPCIWTLTVVETDDRKTVKARLSESVPVEVTFDKSVIVANWRKNW
ncbi:MAG: SH3 domain-containing protein [Chloroflexi bacterium]|nr:MAG: SH3 domain-containing protein [Chloroflexota bacterium]